MIDNLKAFMELVSKNDDIRDRILNLNKNITDPEENRKALIALAAEYGAVLTEEDLVTQKKGAQPISDDELEAVTGGASCSCPMEGVGNGDCYCACVLSGTGDNGDEDVCYCRLGGSGL